MVNLNYLRTQLRIAADCISRCQDAAGVVSPPEDQASGDDQAEPSPEPLRRHNWRSWEEVIAHYKQPGNVPFVPLKRVSITNVGTFDVPDLPAEPLPGPTVALTERVDNRAEGHEGPCAALPVPPKSLADVQLEQLFGRVAALEQIVLAISEDACSKHGLYPF